METPTDRAHEQVSTRRLTPGTARATLLNILGDLTFPNEEPVPTAAFIHLMEKVGYTQHAARQAVSRCVAAGWIDGERRGRTTSWSLTATGQRLVADGIAGVERLSDEQGEWDGQWLVLVVSIPRQQRSGRDRLYRALRWDGFGNPSPAIWVSPHPDRYRRTAEALESLGLEDVTLSFRGRPDVLGMRPPELVAKGWDTHGLTKMYRECCQRFGAMSPKTDEDHAIALLQLDGELQQLLVKDPQLPDPLLPGWSGRNDAATLLTYRQEWRPAAREYWRVTVESYE
jgi:phenylacetic acid degradation operon negative regulatory protein